MFNFQVEFSGIVASDSVETDAYGVEWIIQAPDGWGGTPSTRETIQRTRSGGGWSGLGYPKSRELSLSGTCIAPDADSASRALDRLNAAATLSDFNLYVTEGGRTRHVVAHRVDAVLPTFRNHRAFSWVLGLASDDWRKFYAPLSGTARLPSTTGGLTIPFTIPFTIPAVTNTGQVNLTNDGNADGPVSVRIYGPVSGPTVTHSNTGKQLSFSSSLVVGEGEYLDIDMDRQTVLANGQSSRSLYVTSRGWSSFRPGDNIWEFTSLEYNPTAAMMVIATPADL